MELFIFLSLKNYSSWEFKSKKGQKIQELKYEKLL